MMRYILKISVVLVVLVFQASMLKAATLVHEWKFDGNVLDTSGNGNDGMGYDAIYNEPAAPSYDSNGAFGSAVELSNEFYVTIADANGLPTNGTASWSMNLWLKNDQPFSSLNMIGAWGWSIAQGATGYNGTRGYINYNGATGLEWLFWPNTNELASGKAFVTDGQWHMYTVTFNGLTMRMYLDGVQVASGNRGLISCNSAIQLGGKLWEAPAYTASFDEFTIWSGVLDVSEIQGLYGTNVAGGIALNVYPKNGQADIDAATSLIWETGRSIIAPNLAHPDIVSHIVRYGLDQDTLGSQTPVILPAGTTEMAVNLLAGKTYYWCVNEQLSGGAILEGPIWSFDTIGLPVIDIQPVSTIVNSGQSALITVIATNPIAGALSYRWYSDPNTIPGEGDEQALSDGSVFSGTNTASLTFLQPANAAGRYYCAVSNTNGTVYTDQIRTGIKEVLAQWKFDSATSTASLYADASGNGNAANANSGSYVNGIVDGDGNGSNIVSGGAANFTTGTGWASVENFNAKASTGQFSISVWIKPSVSNIQWNIIASERDGWAGRLDNNWQLLWARDQKQIRFESYGGGGVNTATDLVDADVWTHVVATCNGKTSSIYINGELSKTSQATMNDNDGVTFRIGVLGPDPENSSELFVGNLDDMKVFNYSLSASEVAGVYVSEFANAQICIDQQQADLDGDCIVSVGDLTMLAQAWLVTGIYPIN